VRGCSKCGGRREIRIGFRRGNLKEIEHLEDLGVDVSTILKN